MVKRARNPWILVPCGTLVVIGCCLILVLGSCEAILGRRGSPQLSTTVLAIQQSPVVPGSRATVAPPPQPTRMGTSSEQTTVQPPAGTATGPAMATQPPTTLKSCDIVSARLIGDGGDQDWSHSTGLLAFDRTDANGVYQLYVGNPETNDFKCLTCVPRPGAPPVDRHKIKPVWDPTGSFIVLEGEMSQHPLSQVSGNSMFSEVVSNGAWSDLYATTSDGGSWFKLTNTSSTHPDGVLLPAFSPDGRMLMWSRLVGSASLSNPFGLWRLMIADFVVADGVPSLQNARDITPPGARFIESHVFSPDGQDVMFAADINSTSAFSPNIWTLNLASGLATNLTHDSSWDEHAVYTLDGKHIVYMSSSPYPRTFLKADLMIMNVDGSEKRQFSHFNERGYPEYASDQVMPIRVSWNAHGTEMAVTLQSGTSYPSRTLWLVSFAGSCGT